MAGCDSSDGLAAAVEALATASGCAAVLDQRRPAGGRGLEGLAEAEAWCLWGGEDFELVLALEPAWAECLVDRLEGSRRIGRLVPPQPEGPLTWAEAAAALRPAAGAFRHFG